jgi:hypothetical protein
MNRRSLKGRENSFERFQTNPSVYVAMPAGK